MSTERFFPPPETPKHLLSEYPRGDAALGYYERFVGGEGARVETMREVVYSFLDQELRNSHTFKSEQFGAEFPYTSISVKKLAEELFARFSNADGDWQTRLAPAENRKEVMEFMMASVQGLTQGHQFEYAEINLDGVVKHLPAALEDLAAGREPAERKFYTLGFPTNEAGLVNDDFNELMKSDAFKTMGALYAELIGKELAANAGQAESGRDDDLRVVLSGVSMGASMAAEAAAVLLKEKVASQDPEEKDKASLSVNMYLPAGLNRSSLRMLQIPLGFVADAVAWQFDEAAKKIGAGERAFIDAAYGATSGAVVPRMDAEQQKLKTESVRAILKQIIAGVPLPEGLKVNEIVGVYDPLMFSPARLSELNEKKGSEAGKTLGASYLGAPSANERVFALRTTHNMGRHKESAFKPKRWDRLAGKLLELKAGRAAP